MLTHEYALMVERLDDKSRVGAHLLCLCRYRCSSQFPPPRRVPRLDGHSVSRRAPRSEANEIILHARMLDLLNLQQQEALGILGLNLIYGAFFHANPGEA